MPDKAATQGAFVIFWKKRLKNLEYSEKLLIFAASEWLFWLSGQNPERARLYRHYPFLKPSVRWLLLFQIPLHEHFDIVLTFNKLSWNWKELGTFNNEMLGAFLRGQNARWAVISLSRLTKCAPLASCKSNNNSFKSLQGSSAAVRQPISSSSRNGSIVE